MRYDVTKLQRARLLLGWTQSRLAEETKLAPSTIGAVERGDFQKPSTIKAIAYALNVPMEELLIEETKTA